MYDRDGVPERERKSVVVQTLPWSITPQGSPKYDEAPELSLFANSIRVRLEQVAVVNETREWV